MEIVTLCDYDDGYEVCKTCTPTPEWIDNRPYCEKHALVVRTPEDTN